MIHPLPLNWALIPVIKTVAVNNVTGITLFISYIHLVQVLI